MASDADLETKIQHALQTAVHPLPAKDICKLLGSSVHRSDVNRVLYSLLKRSQVVKNEGTPPTWGVNLAASVILPGPPVQGPVEEELVIFIDLGCTHDCLKNLVPYAREIPHIYAFADLAFNGWGVNPPAPEPIHVYQSQTSDSNSADLELIWTAAKLILSHPQKKYHFIVATKDMGFRSLKTIVEREGHRLDFVTKWEDMRVFIE